MGDSMMLDADILDLPSDSHQLPLLTLVPDEIEELYLRWYPLFPLDIALHWPEIHLLLEGEELALEGHEVMLNQLTPVNHQVSEINKPRVQFDAR
jgi:hypothetical protein